MIIKPVSYKGVKALLPENVSISAFKEIVDASRGFDIVQPMIDILSRRLPHTPLIKTEANDRNR